MESTGTDWKKTYHWANVIVIPIWAFSAIIANSSSNPTPAIMAPFWIGSIWIVISGIINSKVRKSVLRFLKRFFTKLTATTVALSCVFAGFTLLFLLMILGLLATFMAIGGLLILAIYLFVTSTQALSSKAY